METLVTGGREVVRRSDKLYYLVPPEPRPVVCSVCGGLYRHGRYVIDGSMPRPPRYSGDVPVIPRKDRPHGRRP